MRGKIPHIVQYQGSKRILAPQILQYMPNKFNRLLEPFSGMAAISIAAAYDNRTDAYVINDINAPLIRMLQEAVDHPQDLLDSYSEVWAEQFTYGDNHVQHYYDVREKFNAGEQTPANMLYLLARCVKGAVRYGKNGNFNQSPDKRRHGTNPKTLESNVYEVSRLLKGKVEFLSRDYHDILKEEDCPEDIFTATSGLTLRGSSGYRFTVSDDLVECYQEEPGDWRWRGGNEDCHFFAYDLRSGIPIYSRIQIDAATYLFVGYGLSFPEVYLNKAEAEAMLDKAGDAINTINVIRTRRIENPTSIDGLSGEDLVKYIRRERRRELSFLYHRWFDLRRYAVAPKYPEAMTVEHVWEAEESDLANGTYVLNPYPEDGGWVLPFPSHVLEDNHGALVDNVRPARNPIN